MNPIEERDGSRITQPRWKRLGAICAIALIATGAEAQVGSLVVGNWTAVTNALGRPFHGVNGYPEISARVEIREVGVGIIPPDPATGLGNDGVNPLARVSHIGHDVPFDNSGMFAETFSNRLDVGKSYFARVYDGPSPGGSIYYVNSMVFVGPPPEVSSLEVVFQSRHLVNGEPDVDTDGDGIPDAMEGDMGLDPNSADTDGDGYSDFFEAIHDEYLQPGEPDPSLEIQITPPFALAVDPHTVSWQTIPVPNMEYRLEYRPQWTDETAYEEVWSGTATDTNLEIDVEGLVTNVPVKGFFRVTVPYSIP